MAMQEEDQRRSAADALGQLPSRSDDVGSEAAVKQAYNDWQDTKPSLFSRQTLTGGARERQAEAAYSKALQASYGRVKFGGNPGATAPSTPAPSTPQYATLASVEGTKKPGAVDMLMGTTQPSGNQVMLGVYNHGRGQYSDSPDGMNFKQRFTGQLGEQNMNAAGVLDGSSQNESITRVAASQPQQGAAQAMMAAPSIPNSSNDWQARNDLRNAYVSANSITNTRRWRGRGAENSPSRLAYAALLQNDMAMRQAQPGLHGEAMRQNGSLQRENMQQQGANARAVLSSGIDTQRVAIEQERANNESRAARQLETQRSIAIDPRATPEQRSAAERALMTLQGRQTAEWGVQVTPTTKNTDGSTSMGSIVRFNKATGQTEVVQPQGQGGGLPQGMSKMVGTSGGKPVYEDANGNRYIAG